MKVFAVYTQNSVESLRDVVAVQKSFNVWAVIFNFWWALFKKQYYISLMIFLIFALIGRVEALGLINDFTGMVVTLFMLVFFGIESGDMIESGLKHKGFQFQKLVYANSSFEAKYMFCHFN